MVRVRVLGGGWYGCHIADRLIAEGYTVELHERSDRLFSGASGGNPARLHLGFHYPRSRLTRAASQEHYRAFMTAYGHLTRAVPVNLYCIASHDSLIDFGTYRQVLKGELEFVTVEKPSDFGLENVEGALLTGERHIVIDEARRWFEAGLGHHVRFRTEPEDRDDFDWTIDCTFCARDATGIDRYEPCITVLLEGPTDRAITIMDGPFPSVYPWDETQGLSSLTSASLTPFSKAVKTHEEARAVLAAQTAASIRERSEEMVEQLARFYPAIRDEYRIAGHKLTIRAQPRSGSDARLVDIVQTAPKTLRIRAGKIDAILHAREMLREWLP